MSERENLLCRRRVLSVSLDRDLGLITIALANGDQLSMSLMAYERLGGPRPGQVIVYEILQIQNDEGQKEGFRRVLEKGELMPQTLPGPRGR